MNCYTITNSKIIHILNCCCYYNNLTRCLQNVKVLIYTTHTRALNINSVVYTYLQGQLL